MKSPRRLSISSPYKIGDIIEARYKNGFNWFRGEITFANKDGSYDIQYEDGDTEEFVQVDNIRSTFKKCNSIISKFYEGNDTSGYIKIGTIVEVKFEGRDRWFIGVISSLNEIGTYNIIYDNGRKEAFNIKRTSFRLLINEPTPFQQEENETFDIENGTKIESRTRDTILWASGYVSNKNDDGTYNILYDNQELKCNIERKYVRLPLD